MARVHELDWITIYVYRKKLGRGGWCHQVASPNEGGPHWLHPSLLRHSLRLSSTSVSHTLGGPVGCSLLSPLFEPMYQNTNRTVGVHSLAEVVFIFRATVAFAWPSTPRATAMMLCAILGAYCISKAVLRFTKVFPPTMTLTDS